MSLTHLEKKQSSPACGNCKHFVAGGKCTLVQGGIEAEMLCDFFEVGMVLPMYSEVDPPYTKHESNYRPLSFQEAIGNVNKFVPEFKSEAMANLVNTIIEREHFLIKQGIPPMEVHRVVVEEFSKLLNVNENDWVNQPQENVVPAIRPEIPDTGYPPILPLPVFAVTSPFDNDGFDHRNPDPPGVDPNVIIKDESTYRSTPLPGYAGGRDVENLTQYKTNAPENIVLKSEANPYENQNAKNYIDAPFKEPANPSMHNEYGFNVKKSIPEWRYDVEDDQTGILKELIIERDKSNGRWVKHGTTKGDMITDHSLAPILDHARVDYLHGNKNEPGDPIEMPHMVVSTPELPDDPHEVVDEKLEEAVSKHRQQRDISLDDIPGDTPEEKKATKKSRLEILAPWLLLLGGVAGAGYFLAQPTMKLLAKFTYHGHEFPEICEGYDGRTFDLLDKNNRPVPPSEGLGYTNTHPNCKCTWEFIKGIADKPSFTTQHERDHIKDVNREINKASRKGELHKVKPSGGLTKKTFSTNFRKIQETIEQIRQDFDWLSDDYLNRVKAVNAPGRMFLIRASSEAITDHRPDGEPLRRWLKPDELHAMARTAVGMGMDINHKTDELHPAEYRTNAHVLDSEFNKNRNEIQMIIHEEDPEVLQAINNNDITAVSINGGAPRSEKIECPDCENQASCECFIVPEGVILGELDDIALTWVVTNPNGIMFRGKWIAPATPGVKVTAIEPL